MRKDVKRSLVIWPLAASLVTIGVSYHSLQNEPHGRLSLAGLVDAIIRPESIAQRAVHELPISTVGGQLVAESERNPWAAVEGIEDWLDAPVEVKTNVQGGIPAPTLNTHSDLFGFDIIEPAEKVSVEQSADPPDDDLVIRVDPDLFFVDEAPLNQDSEASREDALDLNAASVQLAERPTTEIKLPSVYQAPDAVVADLAPDVESVAPAVVSEAAIESEPSSISKHPSIHIEDPSPAAEVAPDVSSMSRSDASADDDNGPLSNLKQPRSATWPVTPRLAEQLEVLEKVANRVVIADDEISARAVSSRLSVSPTAYDSKAEINAWIRDVKRLLHQLPSANRLGDSQVAGVLGELARLQQAGAERAEQMESRSQRVAWLQAAYSIERRLAVWGPIYEINSGDYPAAQHVGDDTIPVAAAIDRLLRELPETGDAAGWNEFLMLDQLRRSFVEDDDQGRRELAQKFLSRVRWPNLDPIHRQWLAGDAVQDVASAVRPWASGAVDYSALMHQIEKAESNAIDLVTAEVAQAMQALQHANHAKAKQLAGNLDAHYRNANIRFSISDTMLQELLPELPSRRVPVRTTLLGSRVTGVSDVESELRLRILPSPSSWELTLETLGNVSTHSVGRRGPAAVSTSSLNSFAAAKPISVHTDDIELGPSNVDIGGRTRLRGIHTHYDDWPLVGTLVRSLAENEYFDKSPLTERIAKGRMKTQLADEIDRTIAEKVDDASKRFTDTVLGPLVRLQLEPKVIDMQSTDSRLIARYRMAGPWQLASMTPRPRALADNLFSVQVHQSALNNTLEQLVPQDESLPIADVLTECFELLGVEGRELPEDLPEDTTIQFAKHRPITVEIYDGKVFVTMRVIRLDQGDRLHLRNFIVRATYRPQIDGLNASLVRDGHLSVSGPGMSMRQRFPIRTIFNKVLSPNRPLELVSGEKLAERCPEGTGISQFELRDGWVGVSVGPIRENQAVASRPWGIH